MGNTTVRKTRVIAAVNVALVLIGMVLGIISSNTAYAFNITVLILLSALTGVLDLLYIFLGEKVPGILRDSLFFVTVVLTAIALCTVIQGRILLIGYIYFSDLESSNPIAILAMNLAIGSCVAYLLALISNFVIGFTKHTDD